MVVQPLFLHLSLIVLANAESVVEAMADIAADVADTSDAFFNTSLIFNTSLKIAHRFLTLPSRALARLRRLDDMALDMHDAAARASQAGTYDANAGMRAGGYRRHRHMGNPAYPPPMPGPWGFLTSGYFVGLVIMVSYYSKISRVLSLPCTRWVSIQSETCLSRRRVDTGGARAQSLVAT